MPQAADGSTSFNMFGMKARASAAAAVTSPTTEYEAGVAVGKNERFRSYDSAAESFGDYAALIGSSPRYSAAKGTGDDVRAFANALQRGGYATDPNYADKVVKVAAEVKELTSVNAFKNRGA
jgi:flagellar protein FlgJ